VPQGVAVKSLAFEVEASAESMAPAADEQLLGKAKMKKPG
jgi:hypothetical protein